METGRSRRGRISSPAPSGRVTLGVYSLASKSYRDLGVEGSDPIRWVNGHRSILFLRPGRILAVDVESARVGDVLGTDRLPGARAGAVIWHFDLPRHERTLLVTRSAAQSDIWQVTLP